MKGIYQREAKIEKAGSLYWPSRLEGRTYDYVRIYNCRNIDDRFSWAMYQWGAEGPVKSVTAKVDTVLFGDYTCQAGGVYWPIPLGPLVCYQWYKGVLTHNQP